MVNAIASSSAFSHAASQLSLSGQLPSLGSFLALDRIRVLLNALDERAPDHLKEARTLNPLAALTVG